MANKITTVIDFVTTGAQRTVRTFRESIAAADGTVGKFKAGASSAFQSIQQNAGLLAAGAGVAIAGFGAKMIGASQDLAIAAGKFSDATGLAVEDASRLIEVAGDVGVSTESIQAALVKLNQAAAKGNLEKFGIELQKTADGTTDVNATFLETIRVLNRIEDPTKRAQAAQAAFGRGYAEIAELIGTSATELKQRLDDVSDAKVITQGELNNARKFRENVDDLRDSAEDLGLTLGNIVIPAVSKAIGAFNDWFDSVGDSGAALGDFIRHGNLDNTHIIEQFQDGRDAAREFDRSLLAGLTTFDQVHAKVLEVTGSYDAANVVTLEWTQSQKDLAGASDEVADAVADLGDKAANAGPKIGDMAGVLQDLADQAASDAEDALGNVAAAAQAVADAVSSAFDDIDSRLRQQDVLADIAEGWDEIAKAAEEAVRGGADDRRAYERDVRNQRRAVLDLLDSIDSIPPQRKITLATEIETGSLQTLQDIVHQLQGGIVVPVSFATNPGFTSVGASFNPATNQGGLTFNGQQSAIPAGNITNIYPVGTTPTSAQQDLTTFYRRNGITRS